MGASASLPLGMASASAGVMTPANNPSLKLDGHGLDSLRYAAAKDPKSAVREAAKQFEGLFMQELMKGMRQSVDSSGMLDNAGSKLGTEMLDSQYASRMTGLRGGLSDVIARQLERQMGAAVSASDAAQPAGVLAPGVSGVKGAAGAAGAASAFAPASAAGAPSSSAAAAGAGMASLSPVAARQAEFVKLHSASAKAVEAQTGIPANFMVAQAAHESGWGRREIRNSDGSNSFNVFGIKAGANWSGPTATVTTTEYSGGQAHKVQAKFRAYASYEESFADYARLMTQSTRYSGVVAQVAAGNTNAAGFAAGLQRAGYATDPAYADKLTRMMNTTLRLQRSLT